MCDDARDRRIGAEKRRMVRLVNGGGNAGWTSSASVRHIPDPRTPPRDEQQRRGSDGGRRRRRMSLIQTDEAELERIERGPRGSRRFADARELFRERPGAPPNRETLLDVQARVFTERREAANVQDVSQTERLREAAHHRDIGASARSIENKSPAIGEPVSER